MSATATSGILMELKNYTTIKMTRMNSKTSPRILLITLLRDDWLNRFQTPGPRVLVGDLGSLLNHGKWIKLEQSEDISGFQHNIFGGFLSVRPGIFVMGKGKVSFNYFHYRGLE